MPRIIKPRLTFTSAIAFFDHCRKHGKAMRIVYEKADGTRDSYVIVNAPKEETAKIGRSKPASDLRTCYVADKGWRTFKAAQIVAVHIGD